MQPLKFRDFVPRQKESEPGTYVKDQENFQGAVRDFNRWVQKTKVNIVRVETVVLPNINKPGEDGSVDSSIKTPSEMSSTWHQFLRCWYTDPPKDGPKRESGKREADPRRKTGGPMASGNRPPQRPTQRPPNKPKP